MPSTKERGILMTSKQLADVLQELSQASKQIKNETDLRFTMDKYDMLFLGENFNIIYSLELRHSLSKHFHVEISNDELNSLISATCPALNMKLIPMADINDLNNLVPSAYQITLW